ncbi:MAG: CDP-glycerol glycerophosphotransferase family protein [Candidatus Marinimicrobia bacterium]|nr:CDP-glycerol glycerophosphotransferase family protein [Candidatus Neomarinimicrobiota bacterium]
MKSRQYKYLFFITKPYSFPVLEPIQEFIEKNKSGTVCWFTASNARKYKPPGRELHSSSEVMNFNPDAVIVPGNIVPDFWPGLKVQIFHGLDDEPKGFYRITGFFDLYCTFGPNTTDRFNHLAKRHKNFLVRETGWPKLDPLFLNGSSDELTQQQMTENLGFDPRKPIILYAPTFPPKYTSAPDLLPVFFKLRKVPYQFLIKFHTLLDQNIQQQYRALKSQNIKVVEDINILPYLQIADVLITDTSSVAYEYLVLDKPVITYRAIARKDKGINIQSADDLQGAIEQSLADPEEYSQNRRHCLDEIHPYIDGKSSSRVIESIEDILTSSIHKKLKAKPRNYVRKWQIRRLIKKWERE